MGGSGHGGSGGQPGAGGGGDANHWQDRNNEQDFERSAAEQGLLAQLGATDESRDQIAEGEATGAEDLGGFANASGSGYGRGSGSFRRRGGRSANVRQGRAVVRGSLDREIIRRVVRRHVNEVRVCYERVLATKPGLSGRVNTHFVITATGAVQGASVANSTLGDVSVETCITQAVGRWQFPSPGGGGIVMVNYPFIFGTGGVRTTYRVYLHQARRCSDAAGLLLDDRRALWGERLSAANGPAGWVGVYDTARAQCETPSWRDRRALLRLILQRAGGVEQMIQVYRHLSDSGARGHLRAAILRRVRSPEDLRAVREAFGLTRGVDSELVKQVIDRAPVGAGKLRAIRGLISQFPFSFGRSPSNLERNCELVMSWIKRVIPLGPRTARPPLIVPRWEL